MVGSSAFEIRGIRTVEFTEKHVTAEERLRSLCRERGKDWDAMSADERDDFLDELVHEDRPQTFRDETAIFPGTPPGLEE